MAYLKEIRAVKVLVQCSLVFVSASVRVWCLYLLFITVKIFICIGQYIKKQWLFVFPLYRIQDVGVFVDLLPLISERWVT